LLDQAKSERSFSVVPDTCGKDNSNHWIDFAFSLLALAPMDSWNHRRKKFAWKWLTS
jgi:hypothetical protein